MEIKPYIRNLYTPAALKIIIPILTGMVILAMGILVIPPSDFPVA
jgi:hypothetical protein